MLEELESQNDSQVEGLSAKVKMLKDVCSRCPPCCYAAAGCRLLALVHPRGKFGYQGVTVQKKLISGCLSRSQKPLGKKSDPPPHSLDL